MKVGAYYAPSLQTENFHDFVARQGMAVSGESFRKEVLCVRINGKIYEMNAGFHWK